jgi:cyclase
MVLTRVIPCLLLQEDSLVKTVNFKNPAYIGDPINTARIFNELEVDELTLLDITATNTNKKPNFKILSELANECFMPLAYGGGINTFEDAKKIFKIGIEKIIINTITFTNPFLIKELVNHFGSQAIIASIDVKKNLFGKYQVYSNSGKKKQNKNPLEWAVELERLGVGEILLTSINQEGTWNGFDLNLTKSITERVKIPVIANGGASNIKDIELVVKQSEASAVSLGSMVVYQNKGMGVLVNFPNQTDLNSALNNDIL